MRKSPSLRGWLAELKRSQVGVGIGITEETMSSRPERSEVEGTRSHDLQGYSI